TRNYFDADGAVLVKGTARDLTMLRAKAIKAYLMDKGIDPARIDIYPWGATDMLVKADDPNATINDRIEIEFTRD
ncbi:MAG: OmpA family protein, partial [Bacteroidota bacterium]|nr:OmpA family protein [Bacteroidota bacterium]